MGEFMSDEALDGFRISITRRQSMGEKRTLEQAIKSGRAFKRPEWRCGYVKPDGDGTLISEVLRDTCFLSNVVDILADDYVLKPAEVTVTRESLAKAVEFLISDDRPAFKEICRRIGL